VALNPSFAPARQLLAQVYGQLGDQARQHQHMGFSYLLTAKYHLAREHFEEALALDGEMSEAQEGLARVERRLTMLEQPRPADVVRLVAPRYRIR
jgi:predicted Zn-dependent protease